uniref:Uncharacterized protein n=1 Tax=Fundulus heteroclitus TaxID=8078 RepID=A0A3Q2QG31_FUNHE
ELLYCLCSDSVRNLTPPVKHGGESVMVKGCFATAIRAQLPINSTVYISVRKFLSIELNIKYVCT